MNLKAFKPLFKAEILTDISKVNAQTWDGLAATDNPFLQHRFLQILEQSNSAVAEKGWQPAHLILGDGHEPAICASPLYVKSHSYGEYVFDWGWADAYERAGGRYYPKLQCSIPFSPVTGARLLCAGDSARLTPAALALKEITGKLGVSSLHVTFCLEEEISAFKEAGYLIRKGTQFHWKNRSYGSFDDFLSALKSSKRKNIKKERKAIAEAGIEITVTTGEDLSRGEMAGFYPFYRSTVDKKWGSAYLSRRFFEGLADIMPENTVLVTAWKNGEQVAAALNLKDGQSLYGRVWGCLEDYKFLHFELCYYQAIEFAIKKGLQTVEAGAQGMQSKVPRGYEPQATWSAHWIEDPGLREPVARFVRLEQRAVSEEMEQIRSLLPFRES